MKSALEIVAYSNSSQAEGTIALMEVAIAAMARSGFARSAELASHALQEFITASTTALAAESEARRLCAH